MTMSIFIGAKECDSNEFFVSFFIRLFCCQFMQTTKYYIKQVLWLTQSNPFNINNTILHSVWPNCHKLKPSCSFKLVCFVLLLRPSFLLLVPALTGSCSCLSVPLAGHDYSTDKFGHQDSARRLFFMIEMLCIVQVNSCDSIQGLHPLEAAYKDKLHHSSTTKLFYVKGSSKNPPFQPKATNTKMCGSFSGQPIPGFMAFCENIMASGKPRTPNAYTFKWKHQANSTHVKKNKGNQNFLIVSNCSVSRR